MVIAAFSHYRRRLLLLAAAPPTLPQTADCSRQQRMYEPANRPLRLIRQTSRRISATSETITVGDLGIGFAIIVMTPSAT